MSGAGQFLRALTRAYSARSEEEMIRVVDAHMASLFGSPLPSPHVRAYELFLNSLIPTQRATWCQQGYIHLYGSDGALHVLLQAPINNVLRVTPRTVQSFCAVPTGVVPEYDKYYFLKLWIEADVEHFRTVAFASGLAPIEHYSRVVCLAPRTHIPDVPDQVRTRTS